MSSLDRRRVLAFAGLASLGAALAGCGFAPALGPQGPARGLTGAINAADPTDKNGFDLVERLEERLGRPDAPRFDLTYTIRTTSVGVGVTPENAITRFNLEGTVDWALTNRSTGIRETGGTVRSFTAWFATGSTVAGLAAEEDAALRLMRILADQITARLIATSGAWAR